MKEAYCGCDLKQLMASAFTLWDMHLYLDTHPHDKAMLAKYEKLSDAYAVMKAEYEEAYGPLTAMAGSGKAWLKNPWPWDPEGVDD